MPKEIQKEEQQEKEKYNVREIATQTAPVITDGENVLTTEEALVKILNYQEKILKLIKG